MKQHPPDRVSESLDDVVAGEPRAESAAGDDEHHDGGDLLAVAAEEAQDGVLAAHGGVAETSAHAAPAVACASSRALSARAASGAPSSGT